MKLKSWNIIYRWNSYNYWCRCSEGSMDAANILPSLAKGWITQLSNNIKKYRKYFEKDAAMQRRFQPKWTSVNELYKF